MASAASRPHSQASQAVARATSRQTGAKSAAGSRVVTVEEVLAASGVKSAEAVIFVSLPSGYYSSLGLGLHAFCNLRDLDLSGNELGDVSALASLPSLAKLNVAGNRLSTWPSAPGSFPALQVLDCSFNRLEQRALQALADLPKLRELDVSGNGLRALPTLGAATFASLRRFTAGHNELTGAALTALQLLPALQQLLLPSNRIAALPVLNHSVAFIALEVLDLSHCQVTDMAGVQRLQALPTLQRLLLAGNPVAGAGFGASGTIASVLHRNHANARRGSLVAAGAGTGGGSGRPGLSEMFQFTSVEEASVVSLKAKALANHRRAAAAAAASSTSGSASGAPLLQAEREEAADAPADVPEPALGPGGDANEQPGGAARAAPPHSSPLLPPEVSTSYLDWELAEEESTDYLSVSSDMFPDMKRWSNQSAAGSAMTTGSIRDADDPFCTVEDPTVRVALGLGLDPRLLPVLQGPGMRSGNPAAAIKALRFALAHPAAAPSTEGVVGASNGSHLRLTKSVLAKQRQKAGAGGGSPSSGGVQGRVATIDALLLAMKRRLAAVQAAMAADVAQTKAQEAAAEQQQREQEEEKGAAVSSSGPVAPEQRGGLWFDVEQAEEAAGSSGSGAAEPSGLAVGMFSLRAEREQRASALRMRQAAHAVLGAAQ